MAGHDNSKKDAPKMNPNCPQQAGTIDNAANVTHPSQPNVPAHSISTSGTMRKKPLSKAAFARLALVPSSDELKPIRRPLPATQHISSDSEDSSAEPDFPTPKHRKYTHPFYNADESDTDMSSGLSPSPSPKHQTQHPSLSQPDPNIRPPATMSHSNPEEPGLRVLDIVPRYMPLRRGFVTPTTDFDELMHFQREAPRGEREEVKRKKAQKTPEKQMPGFNCSSSTETPIMSWLIRAKEMGLRPDCKPSTTHALTRAGTMGTSGIASSVASGGAMGGARSNPHSATEGVMGGDGQAHSVNSGGSMNEAKVKRVRNLKKAARRSRGVPKRAYTWKDPEKKNKSGKRDPEAKGKGKGKEREM